MLSQTANGSGKPAQLALLGVVAAAVSFAIATPALAESNSATMSVSAVIQNNCNVAASPMSFSGANVTNAASVSGTARISVNCTSSTAFTVDMDRGANASGAQRRMVNENGEYLDYEIFSDASRTKEWGRSAQSVSDKIEGASRKEMIAYGRINAVTKATQSGIYRDTITVTVNF